MTTAPATAKPLNPIDISAIALIVSSGAFSLLPSWLPQQYELTPLLIGLALLLLNHGRQQPQRYLYLALLLLLLKVYLQADERYLASEISLFDYIMIALGFAATQGLAAAFWSLLLRASALALPLAALVSHQLRSGPGLLEPFNAGELSINQTALLMGACLTVSLCFLWSAITTPRPGRHRLLSGGLWLLSSLLALGLVLSTRSRFGFGLPLLATLIVLAVSHRTTLRRWLQRFSQRLQQLWQAMSLPFGKMLTPGGLTLAAAGLLASAAAMLAIRIYSSPRNSTSDMHRLYLLKCYFSALFTGRNRLVHGLGFTTTSNTICKDIGLIKGTTHAHNIFAQVAADNGLFALLAILIIAGWMLNRIVRNASRTTQPVVLASAALNLFILASLQIEGGWGKVTWIQALIGLAIGSLTMSGTQPRLTERPIPAGPDPGTSRSDP